MFDWDRFKNGEIAVHCDTEEKANYFLKECDKQGIAWTDGDKTTEINCWFWCKKNTSYACIHGKSKLVFDFLGYHKNKGLEIIKWEVKEMKELTFKEVIANIKEGEVWESNCKRIRCLKDGNLKIDNIPLRDFGPSVLINSINIYKLQRKEYTFEEAFKAYEEGKEIKSSKGISYKKDYETEYDEAISMDEIRGKWYIND